MNSASKVRVIRGNTMQSIRRGQRQETATEPILKKRVAAYCRVSTDHEDQETSFEAQQKHFKNLISENPAWELVGIYAEEESGTRAQKRENFMRMIRDCEGGKIDMVLTKSISRWARNTLDSLKYIRKLKALEIPIYFTKEGINTMDAGGEVLVTILASIAQQESASISQNVQIGVRYHFQEGKICGGVHRLLGYNRTPEGSLEIIPEEAEIVQRIYRDYLDGYSIKHIVECLQEEGVDGTKVTASGVELPRVWSPCGIEYILQNEKYAGDLILQKYYTVDFLTKKTALNTGQLPQYYVENNHKPIIPKEVYLQVQAEMARRKKHWQDFRYSHISSLGGRTFCADCGAPYRRVGGEGGYWRCETKLQRKKHPDADCVNTSIREEDLKAAVATAFVSLPNSREELIRLEERLYWGGLSKADELLTAIEGEMRAIEETLQTDEDLAEEDREKWQERLQELHGRWAESSEQRAVYADKALHIRNLQDRIQAMNGEPDTPAYKLCPNGACQKADTFYRITRPDYKNGEFSDDEVIRFVERIEVAKDAVTVFFKAGISITVGR